MIALGIDAGASSCRWALVRDGQILGRGVSSPITGHLFTSAAQEEAVFLLKRTAADILAVAQPYAAVAGVAGLSGSRAVPELLQHTLAEALNLERSRVRIVHDMHVAYRSALSPGDGVLIYAGTGAIACHVRTDGALMVAGGHGHLIDDAGGGFAIGRDGLRTVLRAADIAGHPVEGLLATAVYENLGEREWPRIIETVYSGGRSRIAAIAPAVADAARAGDTTAVAILENAGIELAHLACVLLNRLGDSFPIAVAGGVTRLGPNVIESLRRHLPTGVPLQVSEREPVMAAAEMATELAEGQ